MSDYFGKVLDDVYAKRRLQREIKDDSGRTTLDLALDSCFAGESNPGEARPEKLNSTLRAGIITQLRTFIFAGHDTTAPTICYLFYVLSKNPTCLQRLREELETVLGPTSTTASTLKSSPHLLNRLEYTHCIIKETLRLYPIDDTVRSGSPSLHLTDRETGEKFPTDGYMIMIDQYGMGRSEDIWGPDANDFNPDRFLPENSGKFPKGAYRAFELGPRNCIGQNFAIMEMKIVLALVARVMEFSTALDEEGLVEVGNDGSDFAKDPSFRKEKHDVEGDEMYQVIVGSAQPRDGMPVRVKKIVWRP
ncbi:putative cytochrome protein [Zymoseptoria brevis]|uniref:Putative cytochrome protein n=1 Tax=Zymoseptoria brevis TaxID=1047168 RepID=A0A0F4GE41_9PEZI|nr:putative cytochrome protein [Zymoseptoria brevis]